MSTSIEAQPYIPNMEAAIAPMPFEDQLQPTPEAPTTTLDRIKDFGRTAIDRFNTLTDHLPTPTRRATAVLATTAAFAIGAKAAEATATQPSKPRPTAASFDPTKYGFPEHYFDNFTPTMTTNCAQNAISSTHDAQIKYVNRQHTKVRITVRNSYYKDEPWCQIAGDFSVKAWQDAPNAKGKLRRNSPIAIVPFKQGQTKASVVVPIFKKHVENPGCAWRPVVKTSYKAIKPLVKGFPNPVSNTDINLDGWDSRCLPVKKSK